MWRGDSASRKITFIRRKLTFGKLAPALIFFSFLIGKGVVIGRNSGVIAFDVARFFLISSTYLS